MTETFVILTKTEYGTSGDELPPPPIKSTSVALKVRDQAHKDEIVKMMLGFRAKEQEKPRPEYGERPSYSWYFVETVDELPEGFAP
jgi:hypothetical protein